MHQVQDLVLLPNRRRRRHYSLEHKLRLVQLCSGSGSSLSAVAQANDVNANLLRRWVRDFEQRAYFAQRPRPLDSWPSLSLLQARPHL
jgi:transposase